MTIVFNPQADSKINKQEQLNQPFQQSQQKKTYLKSQDQSNLSNISLIKNADNVSDINDNKNKNSSNSNINNLLANSSSLKPLEVLDWHQTAEELVLVISVGKNVSASSCSASLEKDELKVELKDGRVWKTTLKYKLKNEKPQIKMKKKTLVLTLLKNECFYWSHYDSKTFLDNNSNINFSNNSNEFSWKNKVNITEDKIKQECKASVDVNKPHIYATSTKQNETTTTNTITTSKINDNMNLNYNFDNNNTNFNFNKNIDYDTNINKNNNNNDNCSTLICSKENELENKNTIFNRYHIIDSINNSNCNFNNNNISDGNKNFKKDIKKKENNLMDWEDSLNLINYFSSENKNCISSGNDDISNNSENKVICSSSNVPPDVNLNKKDIDNQYTDNKTNIMDNQKNVENIEQFNSNINHNADNISQNLFQIFNNHQREIKFYNDQIKEKNEVMAINYNGNKNLDFETPANTKADNFAPPQNTLPSTSFSSPFLFSISSTNSPSSSPFTFLSPTLNSKINIVDINDIKINFYEMECKKITGQLYIKDICRSSLIVKFTPSCAIINYKCSSDSSLVTYQITIYFFKEILAEKSSFNVTSKCLGLTLFKQKAEKWGTFLKPNFQSEPESCPIFSPDLLSPSVSSSSLPFSFSSSPLSSTSSLPKQSLLNTYSTYNSKPICQVKPCSNYSPLLSSSFASISSSSSTLSSSSSSSSSLTIHHFSSFGFTGLNNIGNTCFMNSVLQVLANTVEVRNYFLSNSFRKDLNENNPLGMRGRLALAFNNLMVNIWKPNLSFFTPSKLKSLIGQKQNRFNGFLQQDAEELMEFLLDGLHEDLNRIKIKPYQLSPDDLSHLDDKVASKEAWIRHKSRNDSFVVDLFQGQYHSKLTCPLCNKVSVTFDPYSVVQVPIPNQKRKVSMVLFFRDPSLTPLKLSVDIHEGMSVGSFKSFLFKLFPNLLGSQLRVMEMEKGKIKKNYQSDFSLLSTTHSSFLVCQTQSKDNQTEPMYEILVQQTVVLPTTTNSCCSFCNKTTNRLRRCSRCYTTSYCDTTCQKEHWPKHKIFCSKENQHVGCPFLITIPSSLATYSNVVKFLKIYASHSVQISKVPLSPISDEEEGNLKSIYSDNKQQSFASSNQRPEISSKLQEHSEEGSGDGVPIFGIRKDYSYSSILHGDNFMTSDEYDSKSVFFLLFSSSSFVSSNTEKPLTNKGCTPIDFSLHPYLRMEWQNKPQNNLFVSTKQEFEFDNEIFSSSYDSSPPNLYDCLQMFTEPEVLDLGHSWYCPNCKRHCQATKQLSLWTLPPLLILHFKRFAYKNCLFRHKISQMVTFPLHDLDMMPYLHEGHCVPPNDTLYDLYGVINHHGNLQGGHYTSFAKSFADGINPAFDWRLFDDSLVRKTNQSEVVTESAYVLFYRRKNFSFFSLKIPSLISTSFSSTSTTNISNNLCNNNNYNNNNYNNNYNSDNNFKIINNDNNNNENYKNFENDTLILKNYNICLDNNEKKNIINNLSQFDNSLLQVNDYHEDEQEDKEEEEEEEEEETMS